MEVAGGQSPNSRPMDSARSIVLAMEQGHNWTDAVRASLASVPHNERTGEFQASGDGLSSSQNWESRSYDNLINNFKTISA